MPRPDKQALAAEARALAVRLDADDADYALAACGDAAPLLRRLADAVAPPRSPRKPDAAWRWCDATYGECPDHPKLRSGRGDAVSRLVACLEAAGVDPLDDAQTAACLDETRAEYRRLFPTAADTPRGLAAQWPAARRSITSRVVVDAATSARWRRSAS